VGGRTINCLALHQIAVVLPSEQGVAVSSHDALNVAELDVVEEALHVDAAVGRGGMDS
jgi:hypothetical protein